MNSQCHTDILSSALSETFCLGNMSSGTDRNLHMPIYPFLHEFSVPYRHSVFSAVRDILSWKYVFRHRQEPTHAYLPFPSRIFSAIQTFCLQRCTETFCLGNMSSGTDRNLHMPIYHFLHEFSVQYRHSVFSAVRDILSWQYVFRHRQEPTVVLRLKVTPSALRVHYR